MKQVVHLFSSELGVSGMTEDGQWATATFTEGATLTETTEPDLATLLFNAELTYPDGSTKRIEDALELRFDGDKWWISGATLPARGVDGGVVGILPAAFDGELYVTRGDRGRYGFMDENNKIIISCQYPEVREFSNGYCAVSNGSEWGYIDKANRLILLYAYTDCDDFADGLFPVKTSGYWGCVDNSGQTVIDFIYNSGVGSGWVKDGMAERYQYGRMAVGINETLGVIDTEGNYIIPLKADSNILEICLITDSFIICRIPSSRKTDGFSNFALYDINGTLIREDIRHISVYTEGALFATVQHADFSMEPLIFKADGSSKALPQGISYVSEYNNVVGYAVKNAPYIERWIPVKTEQSRNCMNADGNLLFEWFEGDWVANDNGVWLKENRYIQVRDGTYSNYRTSLYDFDGNLLYTSPGNLKIEIFSGAPEFAVVSEKILLNISSGETTEFASINMTGPHTAIVSDGIFYGLIVNGELVYYVKYTKITLNSDGVYTLELGADTIKLQVAINGTIT